MHSTDRCAPHVDVDERWTPDLVARQMRLDALEVLPEELQPPRVDRPNVGEQLGARAEEAVWREHIEQRE